MAVVIHLQMIIGVLKRYCKECLPDVFYLSLIVRAANFFLEQPKKANVGGVFRGGGKC